MAHFLFSFANEKEHVSTMNSTLQSLPCKPRFSQGCESSLFRLTGLRTVLVQLVCFPMRPLIAEKWLFNVWCFALVLLRGISCSLSWRRFLYLSLFMERSGRGLKCFYKGFWKWETEPKESLTLKALIVFILGLDFVTDLWTMSSFRGFISVPCAHQNRMFSMWTTSESFESFTAGKLGPCLRDSA